MFRTSRPAGSVLCRPAHAGGGLGLFVPAAGAGCLIGPHRHIRAPIEALAECPSLPLGWKTDTAALRSGGVAPHRPAQILSLRLEA
jgi:hypothetical protein